MKRLSCASLLVLVASCGARTGDLGGPLPASGTTAPTDAGHAEEATTPRDAAAPSDASDATVTPDATRDAGTDASVPTKDASPDAPPPPTVAPRPIAPLSTSRVTRRTPTLHWQLPAGVADATVDLCLDRACATPIGAPVHVVGSSYTPATALPVGVVYWQLHPATVTTLVSPTWEFTVGAGNAPVDGSWGTTLDVNGDGYADVAVGGTNEGLGTGGAFVYLGSASGIATTPDVTLSEPYASGGEFGIAVASAGDVNGDGYADLIAFIGANVYVYLGGPTGLASAPVLLSAEGPFGVSVASAGDVNGDGYADVLVGGWENGEAYLYLGGPTGVSTTPSVTLMGSPPTGSVYSSEVAGAGDVNGDGYADIVVGVDRSMGNPGPCVVYLGSASGASGAASFTLPVPAGSDSTFGTSVATAGDVNGDGYADIVVGAWGVEQAYLYLGGASGVATTPDATLSNPVGPAANLGFVAGAGDVNGDGFADVLAGGRVFLGSATGLATTFTALTEPTGGSSAFGTALSSAGDVNGDGFADVILGDYGSFDLPTDTEGSANVYLGGAMGTDTTAATTLSNPGSGVFGISVFGATN